MLPLLTNDELVNRELNFFKATLASTFPPHEPPGIPCVSADEQATELKLLAETIHRGNFFFVVDYQTGKLSHTNGLSRWLGWDDTHFQLAHYFNIILPSHLPSLTIMAANALKITQLGNFPLRFVENKIVVQIPLRHRDGTYWLCKRTLSPWQFSSDRRIMALLNEYTLVKPYEGEPLSPHIIAANGIRSEALEELLRNQNFEMLLDAQTKPFTTAELRIARKLAYNPDVSVRDLSEAFKSSERTVETHLRHIRIKAKEHFMIPFATSLEAVRYIRGQALI
ncbi:hypothetical protein [Spirosoma panaciterrae]|uniref:hypothetical protein n=1 Tax=Spirosoma panaciterrae TaxID=496058 RepID=UPI00036C4197|nr:hypothetical protein [Spirosoma panaciterrae]